MSLGQQAYIFNKNNHLLEASEITATVADSARLPLVYPIAKLGTGNIAVSGAYEGAEDSRYEVEIADTDLENPAISAPTFRGAGTGKIIDLAAVGVDAQDIDVRCLSTGIDTQTAEIELEGVIFPAKTAGDEGNAISIQVDESALVFTPSGYSILEDLKIGQDGITGQGWDFDTKTLQGGQIADDAHRICFGADHLHIYLQYKKWEDGNWQYYFIPQIQADVKAGTKVYFVTGGRSVTVRPEPAPAAWEAEKVYAEGIFVLKVAGNSYRYECTTAGTSDVAEPTWPTTPGQTVVDGTVTWTCRAVNWEVHTDIVSIADLWQKVKASSSLLDVSAMAIDVSRAPGSAAVREFSTRTEPYYMPSYAKEGSSEYAGTLDDVRATSIAKTELVSAECYDNTFVGAELWKITGSASGQLGNAVTGDLNSFGPVEFTIPQCLPSNWDAIREDWSYKYNPVARGEEVSPPALCFALRLGINARPQTLELEYKLKPVDCVCPPVSFLPGYLGLTEKGGETMAYLVPDLAFWLDFLLERMRESIDNNFEPHEGRPQTGSSSWTLNFTTATKDYFELLNRLALRVMALPEPSEAGAQHDALLALVTDLKALAESFVLHVDGADVWGAERLFYLGTMVVPSPDDPSPYRYECTTEGSSGVSEPTWPTAEGETVTDGTAVWTCRDINTPVKLVTKWVDDAWTSPLGSMFTGISDVSLDLTLTKDLVDDILTYETTYGVKKNSIIESGVPYTEPPGDYYWEIKGNKAYMPAGFGVPYYSVIKSGDHLVNTQEFAFEISTPCGGGLEEGDKITIIIGGIQFEPTYQVGDIIYLPVVAGQDLHLLGGVDGDDSYVFEVQGSVASFLDYTLDRTNPLPYSDGGLGLKITDGVVPFQVGDVFSFSIESGHWKWRKDGGAWSELLPLSDVAQALAEGLELTFSFGVRPSYAVGDSWEILCLQENKALNFLTPWAPKFKGSGNISFAFEDEVTVDTFILAGHNIAGTLRLQASVESDFSELLYDKVLTISTDPTVMLLMGEPEEEDAPVTAPYWRIVPPAGSYYIGYIFLGQMLRLSLDADSLRPVKQYEMNRQSGPRGLSLFDGIRKGFSVSHSSFIRNADFVSLDAMIEYLKTNNDMPLFFVPNVNIPSEIAKVKLESDNVEPGGDIDLNAPAEKRIYNIELKLAGIL